MIECLVIASVLAVVSTFAFFGNVIADYTISMFDLMLGMFVDDGDGHRFFYGRNGAFTIFFVFQVAIAVLAIVGLVMFIRTYMKDSCSKKFTIPFFVIIPLSIIAIIMSFSSGAMLHMTSKYMLGFGPITYALCQMAVIALILIGITKFDDYESFIVQKQRAKKKALKEEALKNNI